MSLQMQLHNEHVQRRLRIAARAHETRPKPQTPPAEEKQEPKIAAVQNSTQPEFNSGPKLAHETEGLLEPSNAPEPELTVVARPVPWLCEINEVVRKFYGVSEMDFASARRLARLVFVRHVAMYLAKELTTRSYPAIARQMGGRDHTTILNGVRKIQGRLLTDARLNDELDLLVIKIKEYAATRLARVQTPPYAGEA